MPAGSTLYFETSDKLEYKGFSGLFGVGAGTPVDLGSIVWGCEFVTSDRSIETSAIDR